MPANADPIQDIAHLGNVELLRPKLDRSLWSFEDVLGMEVVHSGSSLVTVPDRAASHCRSLP